jgi:hypothetical protein
MYKLTKARAQREALAGGSGSNQDAVDIDTLRQTQAEELVLTLWANTPTAQTYRAEQQAEQEQWMAEWRNGVQRELEI